VRSYDPITITLHWLTAALVAALWVVGQTADYLPEHSRVQTFVWSSHVAFGFALAAILAFRLVWRATSGRRLPAADSGMLHLIAKSTHYLLYAMLLVTLSLGIVNAFVRGYDMYGLFTLPQLGDKDWKKPVTQWHELAANAVMIVAAVHASAALIHHYVWRDGLLLRMSGSTGGREELG
jgi:cytochrome b561